MNILKITSYKTLFLYNQQHRFPTNDELKTGLDIKLRWNSFKESHLQDALEHKRRTNGLMTKNKINEAKWNSFKNSVE